MSRRRGETPQERGKATLDNAMALSKKALASVMRVKCRRRAARNGMKVVAYVKCDGMSDSCEWPDENSFLVGGQGYISVFRMIKEYQFIPDSYSVWSAVSKKLPDLASLAVCRSPEELALAMTIAGKGDLR